MELHTTDLNLRTVTHSDVNEVARMWYFEDKIISTDEAEKAIAYMQSSRAKNKDGAIFYLCFGIFEKNSDTIIGWCGLDGRTEGMLHIFYLVDAAYRNRGYATQCAQRLIRYAFDEARVPFVNGGCDKDNIASYKVLECVGMKVVGYGDNGDPKFYIDSEMYRRTRHSLPD